MQALLVAVAARPSEGSGDAELTALWQGNCGCCVRAMLGLIGHTMQAGSKAEALQQLGQLGVWRLLARLVQATAGALSNGAS